LSEEAKRRALQTDERRTLKVENYDIRLRHAACALKRSFLTSR